jgi:site-specific recombinase
MNISQFITQKKKAINQYDSFVSLFKKNYLFEDISLLTKIIIILRPVKLKKLEEYSISEFIRFLLDHPEYLEKFKFYFKECLQNRRFQSILTESGIIRNTGFRSEIIKRFVAKLIPNQPEKNTMEFLLNQMFYLESDIVWVSKIPYTELEKLFEILDFKTIYTHKEIKSPIRELLSSMTLLAQRMSGMALDADVLKMLPEYIDFENPFEILEKELDEVEKALIYGNTNYLYATNESHKKLKIAIEKCDVYINKAFENSAIFGISMSINQSLLKIRQQLKRFDMVSEFIKIESEIDKTNKTIELALKLIKYNCLKNNIKKLIDDSTQLISYEITQHTAKTGEHYITNDQKEYWKMFFSASGGGIIVGFLCIFKLLFSKIEVSDFGHAFFYSLNYAFGFIAIYLMGFTLATKQPAMTASSLVASIENGLKTNSSQKNKHKDFAELFAKLFRSQFIAFVGNVFLAFPVSLIIIYLIYFLFDVNIAETKADKILTDISPIHSLLIFHAAIAGVFLFLSGIISGSISNRNKYNNMYYRIQEHPWLKLTFGSQKSKKIASWFQAKWPGVASNFWFGVFLGSTASVGVFFGLNLDIRHITFASGNLAIGLFGNDFVISNWMLFWTIFGIGIIGFVNFIVSFLLSLGLAFRSRKIPFQELKFLFWSVWQHFKTNKKSFFYPVKQNESN